MGTTTPASSGPTAPPPTTPTGTTASSPRRVLAVRTAPECVATSCGTTLAAAAAPASSAATYDDPLRVNWVKPAAWSEAVRRRTAAKATVRVVYVSSARAMVHCGETDVFHINEGFKLS